MSSSVYMANSAADDDFLRRLMRETPLDGYLKTTLEREPSFFGAGVDAIRQDKFASEPKVQHQGI